MGTRAPPGPEFILHGPHCALQGAVPSGTSLPPRQGGRPQLSTSFQDCEWTSHASGQARKRAAWWYRGPALGRKRSSCRLCGNVHGVTPRGAEDQSFSR
jgi:hypothetical protein